MPRESVTETVQDNRIESLYPLLRTVFQTLRLLSASFICRAPARRGVVWEGTSNEYPWNGCIASGASELIAVLGWEGIDSCHLRDSWVY